MTKIDVISGFLGAGKTTLIKKLLKEAFNEKVVLIENEFGEIGVDGSFLKDAGIEIKEINSGCICCSLVGDFEKSLAEVIKMYRPDRIIIEPSGVGKLTDIIDAIDNCNLNLKINSLTTVVDGSKCKMYVKNFGEFFNNQIQAATTVIVSRADKISDLKMEEVVDLIREINPQTRIITTPITELSGDAILKVMENNFQDLEKEINKEMNHKECCGHHHHDEECCEHHHHEEEHEECCCGHHHHDDECCEHHHHEEEHDECCCGHHHDEEECSGHHHDDECCCDNHHKEEHEECCCGHHHHHHGHDADEIFTSIGIETVKVFNKDELENILKELANSENKYGFILRAKGILKGQDKWLYFDLTPEEYEIREGNPDFTGRCCVIGSKLLEDEIRKLFK